MPVSERASSTRSRSARPSPGNTSMMRSGVSSSSRSPRWLSKPRSPSSSNCNRELTKPIAALVSGGASPLRGRSGSTAFHESRPRESARGRRAGSRVESEAPCTDGSPGGIRAPAAEGARGPRRGSARTHSRSRNGSPEALARADHPGPRAQADGEALDRRRDSHKRYPGDRQRPLQGRRDDNAESAAGVECVAAPPDPTGSGGHDRPASRATNGGRDRAEPQRARFPDRDREGLQPLDDLPPPQGLQATDPIRAPSRRGDARENGDREAVRRYG